MEKLDDLNNLYGLAQCTRDLSSFFCETCFNNTIRTLSHYCYGKQGGRVNTRSSCISYEIYGFISAQKLKYSWDLGSITYYSRIKCLMNVLTIISVWGPMLDVQRVTLLFVMNHFGHYDISLKKCLSFPPNLIVILEDNE